MKHPHRLLAIPLLIAFLLLATPDRLIAQTDQTPSPRIHVVVWGDTLFAIAGQYGVSVGDLVAANGLAQSDLIVPGQQLTIPGGNAASPTADLLQHIVQPGENLYRISVQYGVPIADILALNALASPGQILAGQVLRIPDSLPAGTGSPPPAAVADGVHVVQAGETLFGIATRYGVSVTSLSNANNLLNVSQIFAGQELTIPGAATASTPGYAPAGASRTYTVQPGDTLHSIAIRFNTSIPVLSQINHISNPATLYAGQVLTLPETDALSPPVSVANSSVTAGKAIVVDVSEQETYLYEGGVVIATFISSTGQPGADTFRGQFQIQNKIPNAYAATWNLQMPYWLGFYWAGPLQNGFHALPILSNGLRLWEGYLGTPISYGCVVLSEHDAAYLYQWADIGTPVTVRD